jgi:hypothetical protein
VGGAAGSAASPFAAGAVVAAVALTGGNADTGGDGAPARGSALFLGVCADARAAHASVQATTAN